MATAAACPVIERVSRGFGPCTTCTAAGRRMQHQAAAAPSKGFGDPKAMNKQQTRGKESERERPQGFTMMRPPLELRIANRMRTLRKLHPMGTAAVARNSSVNTQFVSRTFAANMHHLMAVLANPREQAAEATPDEASPASDTLDANPGAAPDAEPSSPSSPSSSAAARSKTGSSASPSSSASSSKGFGAADAPRPRPGTGASNKRSKGPPGSGPRPPAANQFSAYSASSISSRVKAELSAAAVASRPHQAAAEAMDALLGGFGPWPAAAWEEGEQGGDAGGGAPGAAVPGGPATSLLTAEVVAQLDRIGGASRGSNGQQQRLKQQQQQQQVQAAQPAAVPDAEREVLRDLELLALQEQQKQKQKQKQQEQQQEQRQQRQGPPASAAGLPGPEAQLPPDVLRALEELLGEPEPEQQGRGQGQAPGAAAAAAGAAAGREDVGVAGRSAGAVQGGAEAEAAAGLPGGLEEGFGDVLRELELLLEVETGAGAGGGGSAGGAGVMQGGAAGGAGAEGDGEVPAGKRRFKAAVEAAAAAAGPQLGGSKAEVVSSGVARKAEARRRPGAGKQEQRGVVVEGGGEGGKGEEVEWLRSEVVEALSNNAQLQVRVEGLEAELREAKQGLAAATAAAAAAPASAREDRQRRAAMEAAGLASGVMARLLAAPGLGVEDRMHIAQELNRIMALLLRGSGVE